MSSTTEKHRLWGELSTVNAKIVSCRQLSSCRKRILKIVVSAIFSSRLWLWIIGFRQQSYLRCLCSVGFPTKEQKKKKKKKKNGGQTVLKENCIERIFNSCRIQTPSLKDKSENNLSFCAAVIFQHQALLQKLLCKSVNRMVWQKVRSRELWATYRVYWTNKEYITNLRLDKQTFLNRFNP